MPEYRCKVTVIDKKLFPELQKQYIYAVAVTKEAVCKNRRLFYYAQTRIWKLAAEAACKPCGEQGRKSPYSIGISRVYPT